MTELWFSQTLVCGLLPWWLFHGSSWQGYSDPLVVEHQPDVAVKVYFGGDEHISPTLNRAVYPLQSGWASLVVTEDLESKDWGFLKKKAMFSGLQPRRPTWMPSLLPAEFGLKATFPLPCISSLTTWFTGFGLASAPNHVGQFLKIYLFVIIYRFLEKSDG